MGKGDRKTKKGKRTLGSYGNTRKRNSSSPLVEAKPAAKKKVAAKKATAKKATEKADSTKKTTAAAK